MSDAKVCTRCRVLVPLDGFSPDRRAPDGKQPACRACCRAAKKAKRDSDQEAARKRERASYARGDKEARRESGKRRRVNNADKIKAAKKAYYERVKLTPEWQAKEKAKREANKARKAEYDRARRDAMSADEKARHIEQVTAWRRANPDSRRATVFSYDSRRRAAKSVGCTAKEVRAWKAAQPKVCFWCSTDCADEFHVDHFYPLAKGGEHSIANLVIACPSCNHRKSSRDPHEFAAMVGKDLAA